MIFFLAAVQTVAQTAVEYRPHLKVSCVYLTEDCIRGSAYLEDNIEDLVKIQFY